MTIEIMIACAVLYIILLVIVVAMLHSGAKEDERNEELYHELLRSKVEELKSMKPGSSERYHAARKLRGDETEEHH